MRTRKSKPTCKSAPSNPKLPKYTVPKKAMKKIRGTFKIETDSVRESRAYRRKVCLAAGDDYPKLLRLMKSARYAHNH